MTKANILILTKYGRLGASSRLRSLQYLNVLKAHGFSCRVEPLLNDDLLRRKYRTGKYGVLSILRVYLHRLHVLLYVTDFDLVWIEKEALPWVPCHIEEFLLRKLPYVLDYDDAVFHGYDMHPNFLVRFCLGRRLDRLMSKSKLIIAGNSYLARRAVEADANWVERLPTVIDLDRYSKASQLEPTQVPCIVWIGSPSTAHYLVLLSEPLRRLAGEIPFVLRVIGATGVEISGVQVEDVPWTEDTEVESLSSCDVGIMPLEDSPWEQGKCGYKLIQYMACGLPVVASAVGANLEIVRDGTSGFVVKTADDWVTALRRLLMSSELRRAMGQAGRARVEEYYCLQRTGPRLVELLRTACES